MNIGTVLAARRIFLLAFASGILPLCRLKLDGFPSRTDVRIARGEMATRVSVCPTLREAFVLQQAQRRTDGEALAAFSMETKSDRGEDRDWLTD